VTLPRYATVSLDADSTLSGVEGIDWLAARREPHVAAQIANLTSAAMNGELALEAVYGKRLAIVSPTRGDIDALGETYVQRLAPGAKGAVRALQEAGVRVLIVSGGLRAALLPMAAVLGVDDTDVYGVDITMQLGAYSSFDAGSPLTRQDGKALLFHRIKGTLPQPILHVGDGATDAVVRGVVDAFAVYTGFVKRDAVVKVADVVVPSFDELQQLVLG
jgi:HAD superfamily phosphoserine phosphatase-like hydrolase